MSAARDQNYSGSGIERAINGVNFDRGIVNVNDAVDAARNRLAHVVLLGLAHACCVEEMRAGRIQGDHEAALEDGERSIGSIGGRSWRRDSQRSGWSWQCGSRSILWGSREGECE